jgi:hypothetical protein
LWLEEMDNPDNYEEKCRKDENEVGFFKRSHQSVAVKLPKDDYHDNEKEGQKSNWRDVVHLVSPSPHNFAGVVAMTWPTMIRPIRATGDDGSLGQLWSLTSPPPYAPVFRSCDGFEGGQKRERHPFAGLEGRVKPQSFKGQELCAKRCIPLM